ncbi:MFS transporter [Agrococcus versicolor]|uniref:MFS transporter n=1 Tax=Agrococcus versicolor TaxID=501482 RepID=A0ABP5MHP1_9MICO
MAWVTWVVCILAYLVATLHRSSLGAAAPDAIVRFDATAAQLSSLAVLQLVVYAALQIPVGVLVDRYGPRMLVAIGGVLMALGQGLLAATDDVPVAIGARMLVGAGDAATFISVLRLLPSWFSGPRLPQLSQWTGNIGQLGQLFSAVPFVWMLQHLGWTTSFASVAIVGAVVAVLVLVVVRNAPPGIVAPRTDSIQLPASWWRRLRSAIGLPGTQLGFWAHFSTQSPGTVFSLLWGFPILVSGLGYTRGEASGLVVVIIATGVVSGPILGLLSARFPARRSNLVLAIVAHMALAWAVVLLWPGTPPTAVVVWMLVAIGIGGPGSLIGFDFARTFNPIRSLGSANGFVNVGGFTASFCLMALIGIGLDVIHRIRLDAGIDAGLYDWEAFRIALSVQFLALGLGAAMLLHARRRTRRRLQEEDGVTVAPLWSALLAAIRRRRGRAGMP